MNYVCNTATLTSIFQRKISLQIMGFSLDWWILLRLTLKSTHYLTYIILRFVFTNHMYICILQIDSFEKKCWFSAAYYRIWLEGYQIIFVRSSSLAKHQQTFEIKPVLNIQSRSSRTLKKGTPADMERSIYLKPYIYLYSCKTETAIFIATKHEKTIMTVI